MTPTGIYDVAQAVLDCVCEAMDALGSSDGAPEGYGCPCLQYVSAGEPQIDCCIQDDCANAGMLTVHVENVYPSDSFPNPSEQFEPCKAATWVAAIVVTASRCAPSMDEQGNPASAEELTANALLMAVDQYAILTALSCCVVANPPPGKRIRRTFINGATPNVSEGGCASVEVRALVDVGTVCACPPPVS